MSPPMATSDPLYLDRQICTGYGISLATVHGRYGHFYAAMFVLYGEPLIEIYRPGTCSPVCFVWRITNLRYTCAVYAVLFVLYGESLIEIYRRGTCSPVCSVWRIANVRYTDAVYAALFVLYGESLTRDIQVRYMQPCLFCVEIH